MRQLFIMMAMLFGVTIGCVTVDFGTLLNSPRGASFIISGTSAVINNDGACLVWYGENGVTYHLFQGEGVTNDDFDQVTTPGVTARLNLVPRTDLTVDCQVGTIAEVQNVLEIQ